MAEKDGFSVDHSRATEAGVQQPLGRFDLLCSGFPQREQAMSGVHEFDAGNLGCADGLAGEFRRRIGAIPVASPAYNAIPIHIALAARNAADAIPTQWSCC